MSSRRATGTASRKGRRSVLRGASRDTTDGVVVELRKQSQREKLSTRRTSIAVVKAIAADPHTHMLGAWIDEWTDAHAGAGGRPRKHSTWELVLFGQCISVFGSANAAATELADPDMWSFVLKGAAPHLDPEARVSLVGPNRDHYQYFTRRLERHGSAMGEAFRELGAERARQVGLADPATRHYLSHARDHTLGLDGKVFSSPLRTTATDRLDKRTGELRTIRQDPARGKHREGGSSDEVWGSKFVFASIRARIANLRVITDVRHVANGDGRGEVGVFVDAAIATHRRLPGIETVVADGALRGAAINQIQTTTGAKAVCRPRRKDGKHGGLKYNGTHYAARPLPLSKGQRRAFAGCSGHGLVAAAGTLFERVITGDGSVDHVRLKRGQFKKEHKPDGTYAMRAQYSVVCVETGATHSWWESLTALDSDELVGFNRAEYLRAVAADDPDFDWIYGMRADTESLHAQLEFQLHKQRLPAWGAHRQTLVIMFAAMAHNAWCLATWQREVDRQQAPPGAAA
jgi:hypothetical protein